MKSIFKKLLYVYLILLLVLIGLEVSPVAPMYKENPWINQTNIPWIIPHGGAKALYPENTIYAFSQTSSYDVFEVDLTLTKDDILISHHDLDIRHDLALDGDQSNYLVRDYTYSEIIDIIQTSNYPYVRAFTDIHGNKPYATTSDMGILNQMLPETLESLFTKYSDKRFILELKDLNNDQDQTFTLAANALLSLIEAYDMADKVLVSSFDDDVIKYFDSISGGQIHTSAASNETLKVVLMSALSIDFIYNPNHAALAMPVDQKLSDSQKSLLSFLPKRIKDRIMIEIDGQAYTNLIQSDLIEDLKRHNISSIYWTVNDLETMRKLIELNVDGIITDRPDLLKTLIDEMFN